MYEHVKHEVLCMCGREAHLRGTALLWCQHAVLSLLAKDHYQQRYRCVCVLACKHTHPLPHISLQILGDVQELQVRTNEGSSELCCFDSRDIVLETSNFDDDPVAAAREIFVRTFFFISKVLLSYVQHLTSHIDFVQDKGKFHVFYINTYSKLARHIICEVDIHTCIVIIFTA